MRGGKGKGGRDKVLTFNVGEGTSGNCKVMSIVCREETDKRRRKDNEQKGEKKKEKEKNLEFLLY